MSGPQTQFAQEIHAEKHRLPGETFEEYAARVANALKDNDEHFHKFKDILSAQRFAPGGRIQAAMGSPREVTPYNCFVSGTIEDNFVAGMEDGTFFQQGGIMARVVEAVATMRMGGGIGYDFSDIRPRGDIIASLGAKASGPVSMMGIFAAACKAIMSAGHRRGAQMAVLRVDHPDIEEFIVCKNNDSDLKQFNISVAVTDEFMRCVMFNLPFDLTFKGRVYKRINARNLWETIMRSTWTYAEPGVIFIDRINEMNNLHYCETISATNPCGEQPLPPYGACLLGSINLTKYCTGNAFDEDALCEDIPSVVRAMDNVVGRAIYPLYAQQVEARNKRRMGIGVMGLANAAEYLGFRYGSDNMLEFTDRVMNLIKENCYAQSALLAEEKGAFPLYDRDAYLSGHFVSGLSSQTRDLIGRHGIRNSHLTSIAPTGTISLGCDNVSGGIEPPFSLEYTRKKQNFDGETVTTVQDYAYREWGISGVTSMECEAADHVRVLTTAQKHVDSAVSKTCNVNPNMKWNDFKDLYMQAWTGGAKGCTTFNPGGQREGILQEITAACTIDPTTGERSCE